MLFTVTVFPFPAGIFSFSAKAMEKFHDVIINATMKIIRPIRLLVFIFCLLVVLLNLSLFEISANNPAPIEAPGPGKTLTQKTIHKASPLTLPHFGGEDEGKGTEIIN